MHGLVDVLLVSIIFLFSARCVCPTGGVHSIPDACATDLMFCLQRPATTRYTIQMDLYEGSEIADKGEMHVQVCICTLLESGFCPHTL